MIERRITMTGNVIENLAAKFQTPKFYVQLKLMRLGEDPAGIEASMKEDLAVVKKIAGDTGQAEPKVRHDFFMQLQAYKGDFEKWNSPVTPEELILKSLRALQEKRYVGVKPKLAILLEMGKPQKSARNSTYRRVTFLVEPDIPGSAWELIRTILWGAAPDVKVGEACHVILEKNQGWTNIKECDSADPSELPEVVPGDPRYRVMKLGVTPPKTKQGTRDDGSNYEFETSFLTLLIQNPEDPESSIVREASTTFAQRWWDAPNDKVLNTIITQAETDKGTFFNVGDCQESKDQSPLAWPDLETIIDFSPDIIADYVGSYVIMDGTPTSIIEKEGAKGPFYVMEIHNPLTGSDASMMLRDTAYLDGGVLEEIEGRPYFLANRIKALVRVSRYVDQNDKERISKIALALWNMDSVLPDLPEDLGIEEEGPADQVDEAPTAQMDEGPAAQQEPLPEDAPIASAKDLLKPGAQEEIRPAQQEAVDAGILTQDEAKAASHILNKEVIPSAQGQIDAPQTSSVQEAPAPTSKKAAVKGPAKGLFEKKAPAAKGAINESEQQRINALRSRLAVQKGSQTQAQKAETPL
jgi:hypothetical protein